MESYKIVIGLSDIKFQLMKKYRINKSATDVKLWFSQEGDILYVHDYDDHATSMVIGLLNKKINKCYLDNRAYAADIFEYAKQKSNINNRGIFKVLNDLNDLYGTWRLGRR